MNTGDWIGTALTIFGFGFSVWAFMLKKAIDTLAKLNESMVGFDKRITVLEQWRQFRDEEIKLLHRQMATYAEE